MQPTKLNSGIERVETQLIPAKAAIQGLIFRGDERTDS
jgi:hypothetical protein